jgi:hypothetical protein
MLHRRGQVGLLGRERKPVGEGEFRHDHRVVHALDRAEERVAQPENIIRSPAGRRVYWGDRSPAIERTRRDRRPTGRDKRRMPCDTQGCIGSEKTILGVVVLVRAQ